MAQILTFALFVGSSGVSFGLLLSLHPDVTLDGSWERWFTWGPYIAVSGFCTLLGIGFLIWVLFLMAEVQFGDAGFLAENWKKCNFVGALDLGRMWEGLVAFEVICSIMGCIAFTMGWRIR
jgi:hypothetical protein